MAKGRRPEIDTNKPWLIFSQGESFHNAAFYLRTYEHSEEFGFPIHTCYAFSTELFLKCLATINGGKTPMEHDLEVLYQRVAPAHQARIKELYLGFLTNEPHELEIALKLNENLKLHENIDAPDPMDFEATLAAGKRGFESMRYGYEARLPNQPVTIISGQLLRAVRTCILEIHPEWRNIQHITEQLSPPTWPIR